MVITSDGRTAVSASRDYSLGVWDTERGKLCRRLQGHRGGVNAVALTPNGQTAVSASVDTTLRVWDVSSGQLLKTLEGHANSVSDVALTSDGKTAVSVGWDYTLRVWNIACGKQVAIYVLESPGQHVAIAANDRIVVGTDSGQLHFLTPRNWPVQN